MKLFHFGRMGIFWISFRYFLDRAPGKHKHTQELEFLSGDSDTFYIRIFRLYFAHFANTRHVQVYLIMRVANLNTQEHINTQQTTGESEKTQKYWRFPAETFPLTKACISWRGLWQAVINMAPVKSGNTQRFLIDQLLVVDSATTPS